MIRRLARPAPIALAALLGLSAPALAQYPPPRRMPPALPATPGPILDAETRSGHLMRSTPVIPTLPPDPKRDGFYDGTRWANYPEVDWPNLYKHGGLYGLRYRGACTATVSPYFQGYPGQSTIGPQCCPPPKAHRLIENILHPWRPVGYYYSMGNYVPIYDLDPLVTGPGPFPWPVFYRRCLGG
ncbi:MAG TPA: hypothetical protein VG406_20420 [Isosphaeraceae bacterium]|jgi:hypothetical protein|nr:hypothetical protein [Isosphaeraceae bacterium]